ncbi:MAG TPA: apolipoprotein N-acyltransferase, partial [Pyrinomonadaceae bacterium]|nr:apolipoprotein N-acyltransferase [Pyrinomonadaceae bacterium]
SERVIKQFGSWALIIIPFVWVSAEWLRYEITGQLWNALGYSQAFHPLFIQAARWGGVYATSFMLALIASALALVFVRRDRAAVGLSSAAVLGVILIVQMSVLLGHDLPARGIQQVVSVQPNVPAEGAETPKQLLQRHLELTERGLRESPNDLGEVLLVIWPESPMNFSYSKDRDLQQAVRNLTQKYSSRSLPVYVLLNSLEPAKGGGDQNSAILVNEKGEMSARYDKIRLMPFGEYVPLPHWLPGASSVRGIVGEFTPGSSYTLMPLGALRAGVFICIEAAHPSIAQSFTNAGADVLINISNDGYLGPTPVMRQHLANAVFRAVENNRDLVRVTNTGITALIRSNGDIFDQTTGFHEDVRSWTIVATGGSTFYTRHGDVFVYGCGLISLGFISASFMKRRVSEA